MRLNLRQIEAFRFVHQTGSMTVAGEFMGVSQPAISRLIRDLEIDIGFKLFDRTRGGLTPTADATEFYREVQRSFYGLDRLGRAAEELRRRRKGELRIAANVATSFYLLPDAIQRFHQDWPDIKISMHACASPEVLELVAMRQHDMGIAVVPSTVTGVHRSALPVLDAVCILPGTHPLAAKRLIHPQDLDGEPLLLISDYSLTHQHVFRSLEDAGIDINVILESTFSAPICNLVGQNLGISILEPLTARAYAGPNLVVRKYAPAIPVELEVIHPINRPLSDHAMAFIEIVRAQLASFKN
ncbi:LysR substrate-binding domain-containing protein [Sneathiella marina]|uniref:LysR substrate-binding domain-containing protein n=1 Tax=Sneathiella marina TaxID=2950108 RepID=A0ABY4W324_9PROT|nr:LysR substrate-binding domain-containing protein [Sneathiella marina]USG61581.1 LysR substrate-binding domain-containing protein [Sneathiella marina]